MSNGHYTPAGFAKTSDGTPGQAQLDDSGNLKVNVVAGGVGGGVMTVNDGGDVAEGSTTDPAWVSGAGTVISLLKKIASAGGSAVSIADGSDATEGTTTDAAVTTDVAGTISGKLRGLVKIFSSVWDSTAGTLKTASLTRTATGTHTTPGDATTISTTGMATVGLTIRGIFSGGVFQFIGKTYNDSNEVLLYASRAGAFNNPIDFSTSVGEYLINVAGFDSFTLRTVGISSGSALISLSASPISSGHFTQSFLVDPINSSINRISGSGRLFVDGSEVTQPISVLDGADATQGTTTDAAITSDTSGTVIGFLRGLVKMIASVWDSANARLKVDGSAVTQPVSAVSLPLPTGAATSGLQTTGNASLGSIDTTLATVSTTLSSVNTKTPVQGQATMANSSPVVIASDQSAIPTTAPAGISTTGTFVTFTSNAVALSGVSGMATAYVNASASSVANSVLIAFEGSFDSGATWIPLRGTLRSPAGPTFTAAGTIQTISTTSPHEAYLDIPGGVTNIRVRDASPGPGGATVTVIIGASSASEQAFPSVLQLGTWAVNATQSNAGTNAQSWWTRIGDTTNGPVAVKAASTAAVAADPALVVRSVQLPAGVGQTTMAASLPVALASDQPALSVNASIANGANVVEGSTTDAAVVTDVSGTISSKLRGLVKIFGSVWDSTLNRLNVSMVGTKRIATGTVTNNGDTATIDTTGMATVTVNTTARGNDGHITTQVSNDGGVNWTDVFTVNAYNGFAGDLAQMPAAAFGSFVFPVAGYDTFQITLTGKTTGGSNTYSLQASPIPWTFPHNVTTIEGSLGNGVIVSGAGALSVGIANSFIRTIPYDGLHDATIKSASTLPLLADTALVTTQRDPLPAGTNVLGHVIVDSGTVSAPSSADVYPNDGPGPSYGATATGKNLTETIDGRLRVILDEQSRQNFAQMQLLAQILAVLKASNLQLAHMSNMTIDPGEFLTDSIN